MGYYNCYRLKEERGRFWYGGNHGRENRTRERELEVVVHMAWFWQVLMETRFVFFERKGSQVGCHFREREAINVLFFFVFKVSLCIRGQGSWFYGLFCVLFVFCFLFLGESVLDFFNTNFLTNSHPFLWLMLPLSQPRFFNIYRPNILSFLSNCLVLNNLVSL